jgi:cytochrome aa3 quinol oxidase subunit IV
VATVVREAETEVLHAPMGGPSVSVGEAVPRFLQPHFAEEGFPWVQVGGYAGSLLLTFAAFGLVVHHLLTPATLLGVIMALAAGQAALQLGVFMHLRESRGPAWQILPLGLSFAIAIGLVIASLWIMAFKWGVS